LILPFNLFEKNNMYVLSMGVWQGVAMDSLKFQTGPAMPYLSTPCRQATLGVARMQGQLPAAVFYPLGHPMPYAYGLKHFILEVNDFQNSYKQRESL
jgi:hypothetical protein